MAYIPAVGRVRPNYFKAFGQDDTSYPSYDVPTAGIDYTTTVPTAQPDTSSGLSNFFATLIKTGGAVAQTAITGQNTPVTPQVMAVPQPGLFSSASSIGILPIIGIGVVALLLLKKKKG